MKRLSAAGRRQIALIVSTNVPSNKGGDLVSPNINALNWEDVFSSEPGIGVSIVSQDGYVLYSNLAAFTLFQATPVETTAPWHLSEQFNADFVRERLEWIHEVLTSGKPLQANHIYGGKSLQSMLYPVTRDEQPSVLAITRRDGVPPVSDLRTVESRYIDLGELSILSPRELEVFILLGHGKSVPEVARMLYRSPRTIERHKTEIGHKLGVSTIADIARMVAQTGLEYDHTRLVRFQAVARDEEQSDDLQRPET